MGDGINTPLTRDDVLRKIKENGGTAKGLDLSGKKFETGIDLKEFWLPEIILNKCELSGAHLEEARLWDAHLEGANLLHAHLEGARLYDAHLEEANLSDAHLEGAILFRAHLEGAVLSYAHLEGANLSDAHLEGAYLRGCEFSQETRLESVDWGNYVLGEEQSKIYSEAVHVYRRLKQWYTNAGMYDVAGEFFFREMTARRKSFWWGGGKTKSVRELIKPFKPKEFLLAMLPKKPFSWAWSMLINILCGYGERPLRVLLSGLVIVLGLAFVYFITGALTPNNFISSLYYSAVSFTALGYGKWAPDPTGWAKGAGVAEAFIGVFMMALFLITFTRKMTR